MIYTYDTHDEGEEIMMMPFTKCTTDAKHKVDVEDGATSLL